MRRHRRSPAAARGERHAAEIASRLGRALRDARLARRLKQADAATGAGITQATLSRLENDGDARYTLATWDVAAFAVGASLDAYLRNATAAGQPRDAVHLRHQELVIRTARPGGWQALPEELIDRDARTSRAADVLLTRLRPANPAEYALIEVFDWFADVGEPIRDWSRRLEALERYAISRMVGDEALPRTGGCWVVRATQLNRRLTGEHRAFFAARFPGSGAAWLAALHDPAVPLPTDPALLWVSVDGSRLFPARLGR